MALKFIADNYLNSSLQPPNCILDLDSYIKLNYSLCPQNVPTNPGVVSSRRAMAEGLLEQLLKHKFMGRWSNMESACPKNKTQVLGAAQC